MNKFIPLIIVVLMVLPLAIPAQINFVSQSATRVGDNVTIKWKMSTEKNIASFGLEKSIKGEWIKFATVDARGKNPPKEYSYSNGDMTTMEINYRIKLIDSDGKIIISNVMTVAPKKADIIIESLAPSPVISGQSLSINFQLINESEVDIMISDATGRQVGVAKTIHGRAGTNEYSMVVQLSTGYYFLYMGALKGNDIKKFQVVK